MTDGPVALVLHGGAGAVRGRDYGREIVHMRGLVEIARTLLNEGASALDVVVDTVRELESSGLYVAGRGSSPNTGGRYELDASLMCGPDRTCGAVAALEGVRSPIAVARAVMERTPHVLLAGSGAASFARAEGLETIDDPDAWFTRAGQGEDNHPPSRLAHGTVGCVALDRRGRLAAATSTGGVFGKLPGRVGDAPIIGAGTWADGEVAVSSTGQGEYFQRTVAAARVSFLMTLGGMTLRQATEAAVAEVGALGGDGGVIAVDRRGNVAMPYNSQGMKRAVLHADGRIESLAFEE